MFIFHRCQSAWRHVGSISGNERIPDCRRTDEENEAEYIKTTY
jgi:hypothetical protein